MSVKNKNDKRPTRFIPILERQLVQPLKERILFSFFPNLILAQSQLPYNKLSVTPISSDCMMSLDIFPDLCRLDALK